MRKLIVAHRGASKLAHENTILAFQKAIDLGSDGIELDVRKTADGILAVFHDPIISYFPVSHITFAQLNEIASRKYFKVPTLAQAVKLIAGKIRVFIEIKERGFEQEVAEIALKLLTTEQFSIISFNFDSLKIIKNKYPRIRVGWLALNQIFTFFARKEEIFKTADFLSINYALWKLGFARIIPTTHPVMVWTVDDSKKIRALLTDPRVQAIFTNLPDLGLKLRERHEP